MNKVKINIMVDTIAFVFFLVSMASGLVLLLALPSGSGRFGFENLFLGLSRHSWNGVHTLSSILFGFMVLVHLLLHLEWIGAIPKMLKQKD